MKLLDRGCPKGLDRANMLLKNARSKNNYQKICIISLYF